MFRNQMPVIVDPHKKSVRQDVLNQESDDAMMFSPPTCQSPQKQMEHPKLKHSKTQTSLETIDLRKGTFSVSHDIEHVQSSVFRQAVGKRTFE